MTDIIYDHVLFTTSVLLIFMGGYTFFCNVPKRDLYKNYIIAKRILGFAYLLWGLEMLILCKFNWRSTQPYLATITNFLTYYAGALCISTSYITLLKSDYFNKQRFMKSCLRYAAMIGLLAVAIITNNLQTRQIMLIIAAIYFLSETIRVSYILITSYKRAVRKVNDYYSDNTDLFVRWMSKSAYIAIVCAAIGSFLAFAPKWATTIYSIIGMIVFIYIFTSFQNYLIHFKNIKTAIDEPDYDEKNNFEINLNEKENKSDIKNNDKGSSIQQRNFEILTTAIHDWIEQKGFCQEGITLGMLAEILGTNRTYLSAYINKEYKTAFRNWINNLRISLAKELLTEQTSMNIEQISREVGFTSSSHFIKLFSENESLTPAEWRKKMNC